MELSTKRAQSGEYSQWKTARQRSFRFRGYRKDVHFVIPILSSRRSTPSPRDTRIAFRRSDSRGGFQRLSNYSHW